MTSSNETAVHGIVNLTRDSFSDGGQFLDADAAISHALQLVKDGAQMIDLGPASSHPDAETVSPKEEVRRLLPVMRTLRQENVPFSVDSYHSSTQKVAAEAGAAALNDIQAFVRPEKRHWLLEHPELQLICMHSVQREGIASREKTSFSSTASTIVDDILDFFRTRFVELETMGMKRSQLWLDPGMGFFLDADPMVSVQVLKELPKLSAFHEQLYVSVSKKSFLRRLADCTLDDIAAPNLAAELFAARQGARILRTHDVANLCRALKIEKALNS
ncbi:MAG: dihydropteroate synthase [Deltaproteobacteria bacterium]|nr:dihydropteroate synthase [Deltaproteobacteria bacterium]